MRYSQALIPTSRAAPGSAKTLGLALLFRGGYARGLATRGATWLPLGRRVLANLEALTRRELAAISAHEVASSPPWCADSFAATAAAALRGCQLTTRNLPIAIYQVASGSPRVFMVGLDETEAWAEMTRARFEACSRSILQRCGLPPAVADGAGAAGLARLFWIKSEQGQREIALDRESGYASIAEVAERAPPPPSTATPTPALESVLTPEVRSVADVADELGVSAAMIIKSIVVMVDGEPMLACLRGDRGLSLPLLRAALGAESVELATEGAVLAEVGCPVGSVGPVEATLPIIGDLELEGAGNLVCGANQEDTHLRHVDIARDTEMARFAAIARARDGDCSPRSGHPYSWIRVRELATISPLGLAPARDAECSIQIAGGGKLFPWASGAELDLTAIFVAAAERHAQPTGIAWPLELAPFLATITVVKASDQRCSRAGEALYRELQELDLTVLIDDRSGAAGAKLTDAELIGAPVRVAIGPRSIGDDKVEIRHRGSEDALTVATSDAARAVAGLLDGMRKKKRQARS